MSRKKNRDIDDNSIFHFTDILGRPAWLRDDPPPAVEIIELNSSNEEISPREPNRDGRRHAWSYVNNEEMQQIENSYKINERARERRRLQNASHHNAAYTSLEPNIRDNGINFNNNYHLHNSKTYIDDNFKYNRNVNCFGMTSNDLVNTDSSTDGEYGDVEVITTADVIMSGGNDWDQCDNNFYNEEIITYDADLDQETRTIWIYSFKNKHLLRDDDFEAVPSNKSYSSSNSTDSSGEQPNNTSRRIGSPTPGTYIPRLDLTLVPTLSTVMEISERNIEPTPDKSIKSVKSTSRKLKVHSNNWCVSESTKDSGKPVSKNDKSTSIINWMSLSPRDRRRFLKDSTVSDTWVGPYLHLSESCTDDKVEKVLQNNSYSEDSVNVQVDVQVHVDNEANGDSYKRTPKSAKNADKANTDEISSINKIKYADAANEELPRDRGDNDVKLVAPVIHLTSTLRKSDITQPIENLEGPEWIHDRDEKETNVYDYVLEKSESFLDSNDNIVDQLWMKNTVPFLKPSNWTKFKSIADSPVSYNLSLGSIEERKTWFRRFFNFLKCCK